MAIALGGAFESLTHVGHIYEALLDEGVRLNKVPCLGSRDLLVPGLLAGVFSVGSVDDGAVTEGLDVVQVVFLVLFQEEMGTGRRVACSDRGWGG